MLSEETAVKFQVLFQGLHLRSHADTLIFFSASMRQPERI